MSQFGLLVIMRGSGPEKDCSGISVCPEDGCLDSQEHQSPVLVTGIMVYEAILQGVRPKRRRKIYSQGILGAVLAFSRGRYYHCDCFSNIG